MRASTLLIVLTMAVPLSTGAQQPKWSGLPPVLLGAVREIQPPEGRGSWVVQVISRGGLDGRGEGDLARRDDQSQRSGRSPSDTRSRADPPATLTTTRILAVMIAESGVTPCC